MITINKFLSAYLILYLSCISIEIIVEILNAAHLKRYGNDIPNSLKGVISLEKLKDINSYTIDNTRLTIINTIISKVFFLGIILSGFLPWLSGSLDSFHFIISGLIFLAVPVLMGALIDLPFGYYHHFHIEEHYGFNRRTPRTWLSDLVKSVFISIILGAFLISVFLIMIRYTGSLWWLWVLIVFISFQILMTVLYPIVIAPIFNKFTPVQDKELDSEIRKFSENQGIQVKGIFQMDAGKRSKHTNAYFAGLGKTKRIVLFDTLLESHKNEEIIAVLAHEAGHLKKRHIIKQMILIGIASLAFFYLASIMISWETLYLSFGFSSREYYIGIFLLFVIWDPAWFFISPFFLWISRRYEREADHYAICASKSAHGLINALTKIALDNLSNLWPHPIYVYFHYAHPPVLERIRDIESLDMDSR